MAIHATMSFQDALCAISSIAIVASVRQRRISNVGVTKKIVNADFGATFVSRCGLQKTSLSTLRWNLIPTTVDAVVRFVPSAGLTRLVGRVRAIVQSVRGGYSPAPPSCMWWVRMPHGLHKMNDN